MASKSEGSLIEAARAALDWIEAEHDHQTQTWHGDYRSEPCDESCGDAPEILRALRAALKEAEPVG